MKHDIIFIERTHRWVCKCGKSGHLKSDMLIHKQEIESEAISDDVYKEYKSLNLVINE